MITEPHIDGIIAEMDERTQRRAAMLQQCLKKATGLSLFSSMARMMFVRPVAAFIRPGGLYEYVAVENSIKTLMELADNPAPSPSGYSAVGIIAYIYFCVIMMQDNPIYATRLRKFVAQIPDTSSNVITKHAPKTALAYLAWRYENVITKHAPETAMAYLAWRHEYERCDDAPRAATAHP